jgi:uncharacterized membrane protein
MKDIPVNARVDCADGECGESTTLVVDPVAQKPTFLVVQDKSSPDLLERLVPVDRIEVTSSNYIRLSCTRAELAEMDPFVERHFIKNEVPVLDYSAGYSEYMMPYASPMEMAYTEVDVEQIPPGQLAIHRDAPVEASDGYVGRIDQFLLDPESGNITHLVLLEGHLLGKKTVTLPLSAIKEFQDGTVYLKLSKQDISQLPAIPVKRAGREPSIERLELVARVFDDMAGAGKALAFLDELQREQKGVIKVQNAAVLTKDQEGKTSVYERAEEKDTRRGRVFGALTGGLVGLVAGPVGAVLGALAGAGVGNLASKRIDAGLSDEFLKNLQDRLQPGTSALIVLVENEWVDSLAEAWKDMDGVVFQHTLSDQLVADLIAADEAEG